VLLRHPWLRANGDSGTARELPEGASAEDVLRAQFEELQGHIAIGERRAAEGDVPAARAAFREAAEEARGLRLADRAVGPRLDLLLRRVQRRAYQACQAAQADTSKTMPSRGDCGTLFAW
jgi:hypothetical protein